MQTIFHVKWPYIRWNKTVSGCIHTLKWSYKSNKHNKSKALPRERRYCYHLVICSSKGNFYVAFMLTILPDSKREMI